MTNLDPKDYVNGQRVVPVEYVAVASGETVNSSSPSITVGPAKAIVAAVGGALVGGLSALGVALSDESVTSGEWVAVALAVVVGSGIVGVPTYLARTTVHGN